MSYAIIVDLDGTLCDCAHRVHHAQAREWDEFHSKLMDDKPFRAVREFIYNLDLSGDGAFQFVALTGRPERYRKMTMEWMKAHRLNLIFDFILMRPDDDWRHDYEVKVSLLEAHFGSKEKVLDAVMVVLDDRDQVVEHLRNYGLTVFQTRQGDY